MGHLPPEDERAWLLDALAGLIARCGAEPLVAAPIVVPSPLSFPDRWSPDPGGIGRLARRILAYAGIRDRVVQADWIVHRDGLPEGPTDLGWARYMSCTGSAGCYSGVLDGTCYLALHRTLVEDPEALTGVLCHQVAHAWREVNGLAPVWQADETAGNDARQDQLEAQARHEEERLTDVTSVYLGFGILAANTAYRIHPRGTALRSRAHDVHWTPGNLSPLAMSFLLAAQIVALAEDQDRVCKWLAPTQKAAFDAACRAIDPDTILDRLGLPPPETWPEPREVDLTPFPD